MKKLILFLLLVLSVPPTATAQWLGGHYRINKYLFVPISAADTSDGSATLPTSEAFYIYTAADCADGSCTTEIYSDTALPDQVTANLDGTVGDGVQLSVANGFAADTQYVVFVVATTAGITAEEWHQFYIQPANGEYSDVRAWNGTAIPGVDTAGYPKVTIKDGTGTGEINTDTGRVGLDITNTSDYLTGRDLQDYLVLSHGNEYNKVSITDNGDGTATATFRNTGDTADLFSITYNKMTGARTSAATLNPENE